MLVNNIDVSTFNIKAVDRDIQFSEVTTYDDWLRQSLSPTITGQKSTFAKITCRFFIRAITYQIALENISNLFSQLKICTVKFNDIDFYFDCTIASKKVTHHNALEKTVEVELKSSYFYKSEITETMTNITSKTINVTGNTETQAVVTVTVPSDTITLTITGFREPIVINNLKANTPIVIDGEDGTVLQGTSNKYGDTDMWEFPVLEPGANTIASSTASCTIQIKYKPRWT